MKHSIGHLVLSTTTLLPSQYILGQIYKFTVEKDIGLTDEIYHVLWFKADARGTYSEYQIRIYKDYLYKIKSFR